VNVPLSRLPGSPLMGELVRSSRPSSIMVYLTIWRSYFDVTTSGAAVFHLIPISASNPTWRRFVDAPRRVAYTKRKRRPLHQFRRRLFIRVHCASTSAPALLDACNAPTSAHWQTGCDNCFTVEVNLRAPKRIDSFSTSNRAIQHLMSAKRVGVASIGHRASRTVHLVDCTRDPHRSSVMYRMDMSGCINHRRPLYGRLNVDNLHSTENFSVYVGRRQSGIFATEPIDIVSNSGALYVVGCGVRYTRINHMSASETRQLARQLGCTGTDRTHSIFTISFYGRLDLFPVTCWSRPKLSTCMRTMTELRSKIWDLTRPIWTKFTNSAMSWRTFQIEYVSGSYGYKIWLVHRSNAHKLFIYMIGYLCWNKIKLFSRHDDGICT